MYSFFCTSNVAPVPNPQNLSTIRIKWLQSSHTYLSLEYISWKDHQSIHRQYQQLPPWPPQFAYRSERGTDDTILSLLNLVYRTCRAAKPMCVSCSLISPQHLTQSMCLSSRTDWEETSDLMLITWITNFLTDRSQQVTRSLQCALLQLELHRAVLFHRYYTDSCWSQFPGCHLIKYADNAALVSLLERDETEHRPALNYFTVWCESSHLNVNT